jgi:hypothetical protein
MRCDKDGDRTMPKSDGTDVKGVMFSSGYAYFSKSDESYPNFVGIEHMRAYATRVVPAPALRLSERDVRQIVV